LPVLEVLTGDLEGRSYPIEDGVFTIGRRADSDLVLPKKYVSRQHAEIHRDGLDFVLCSLSRENPVRADNRDAHELQLEDGQVFQIGEVSLRFRTSGPVTPASGRSHARHRFESDEEGDRSASLADDDDDTEALAAEISAARDRSGGSARQGSASAERRRSASAERRRSASAERRRSASAERQRSASAERGRQPPLHDSATDEFDDEDPPGEEKHERIVFGAEVDDALDDDEKTGVINLDDDEERTGMLDLMDVAVDKGDPFETTRKTEEQERLMKVVSLVGIAAIALVVIVLLTLDTKPEAVDRRAPEFTVALQQVRVWEVSFQSEDPPVAMIIDGEESPSRNEMWTNLVNDEVARVDWILPRLSSTAVFIVIGQGEGSTEFTLKYQRNGDTKTFPVVVKGEGPAARQRAKRMDDLASQGVVAVKQRVKSLLESGDELWRERDARSSEANRYRALSYYEQANEGIDVLRKLITGTIDAEFFALEQTVAGKVEQAKESYKQSLDKAKASFNEFFNKGPRMKQQAKVKLKEILQRIYDKKSLDYIRYKRFQDGYYKNS
jgi:hypothetical protein